MRPDQPQQTTPNPGEKLTKHIDDGEQERSQAEQQ
jgi:hypothetical protein